MAAYTMTANICTSSPVTSTVQVPQKSLFSSNGFSLSSTFRGGTGPGSSTGAASDAGAPASCSDTAASASTASRHAAGPPITVFERRVAWLEEDVAVLHRRLRDEVGEANAGAAGEAGLRALMARLDGELSAERRARETLGSRMIALEQRIEEERKERELQLRSFSSELETTVRSLITRIDDSLSTGASTMRDRTEQTEVRLRTLIQRVDEGLSVGAYDLQDTLQHTLDKEDFSRGLDAAPLDTSLRGRGRGCLQEPPRAQAQERFANGLNDQAYPSAQPSQAPGGARVLQPSSRGAGPTSFQHPSTLLNNTNISRPCSGAACQGGTPARSIPNAFQPGARR